MCWIAKDGRQNPEGTEPFVLDSDRMARVYGPFGFWDLGDELQKTLKHHVMLDFQRFGETSHFACGSREHV